MSEDLPLALRSAIKSFAAQGHYQVERARFSVNARFQRRTRQLGRMTAAVSLGVLAAGIAVFVVVIILNVIFQYAPAP